MKKTILNTLLRNLLFLTLLNYSYSEIKEYEYPYIQRINTGNYIITSYNGIQFADSNINTIREKNDFYNYNNPDTIYSQSVVQFPTEDGGYILVMRSMNLYLFTRNFDLISFPSHNFRNQAEHNIIPYSHIDTNFCSWVIYPDKLVSYASTTLKYLSVCFNEATKISTVGEENSFAATMDYSSLQCKLMKENKDTIVCVYGTNGQLSLTKFKLDTFEQIGETKTLNTGGIIYKIEVIPDENEVAIVCTSRQVSGSSNLNMYCVPYYIKTNTFGSIINISSQCSSNRNHYILNYFYETDDILVGCVGADNKLHLSRIINGDFTYESFEEINLNTICSKFHRLNIVFPSNSEKYQFYTDCGLHDIDITVNKKQDFPIEDYSLNCALTNRYLNYQQTKCIKNIPEGYYCNDTTARTIDKCHDNCKTCNQGGTNTNNNCLTCHNTGKKFFNLGNCISSCEYNYYYDEINNRDTCTSENDCPVGYKLIDGQNKCVKNCEGDYKYEYKNKCYASCPAELFTKLSNDDKCILDCKLYNKYFNYEQTDCINSIPEGYYCNNTDLKTIDKCHSNCKTCNEGSTSDNNNCLICKDNLFYDLGNCRTSCAKGNFVDANNIKTCKCASNTACNLCSVESNQVNLCITCNTDLQYYPKEDETNEFINCYKISDIPSNYYLDTTNKIYKLCYTLCNSCTSMGNINNNQCTQCKSGYFLSMNYNNIKNCYLNCDNNKYHYFDENNNYFCENECPYDYKIINGINKCIKDCKKDFEFESVLTYKNKCYKTCPLETKKSGDICILDCKSVNKYFNYEKTACIASIPEGYYCDNLEINTIDKCHDNCKTCNQGGTNTNNNCLTCHNTGKKFFNLGNCISSCEYNYYYDEINNRDTCTSENDCPVGYKLIDGQNKCVKNCEGDYKYEYKNKCYASCPAELFTKPSNNDKCILDCKLYNKYFNYEQTDCINSIPEGYYCNNTDLKTIDKCHSNCKTCNEGSTSDNNNCLICKDNLFYDLGNCRTSCAKGNFVDANNIKTCKCSTNTTCEYCTLDSNRQNLCITCNKDLNYYKKENDIYNKGDYINCYNEETIPEDYYLDITNEIYKPCYYTCKTCSGFGTETNHKCTECKPPPFFYPDGTNCQPRCNKYYYYDDEDNYHCIDECPEGHILIYDQILCIKKCEDYLTFEYNNLCYTICPGYTVKTDDFRCEINCKINQKYFNYEKTDCIDSIPEGYYCNNIEINTIDKCHENCKTCNQGGTNDNNNCLTCKNNLFYDLGNCKSKCENGEYNDNGIKKCKCSQDIKCEKCSLESNENNLCLSCNNELGYYVKADDDFNENGFINCYKEPEGYFLKDYKYHKCYSSCKICDELGDNYDHKCTECISDYEFKNDFSDTKNCYPKCQYNYYYDSNQNFICTTDNNCPSDYPKLISNKSRCIDDCKKDNLHKYELNNKCYMEPPPNTRPSLDDPFLLYEISQPEEEKNKCNLFHESLNIGKDQLTNEELNKYVNNFAKKYGFFNNYVSKYENNYYKIFIYNDIKCLEETNIDAPITDLNKCARKIKTQFNINFNLINVIVMIKNNENENKADNISYAFADPISQILLDIGDICSNEKIETKKDLTNMIQELNLDDKHEKMLIDLLKNGINVFDPNHDFFHDICYYYDSPINKDIPLKDRAALFYPNITLCEEGCTMSDLNYNEMKVKCSCIFKSFMDKDYISNNLYGQAVAEVLEIINSLNIECMKCLSKVFKSKYFPKCIGGFISLGLLIIELCCIRIFSRRGFKYLENYIFSLLDAFKKYKKNQESNPPKKSDNSDKNIIGKKNSDMDVTKSTRKLKQYDDIKSDKNENQISVSKYKSGKNESQRRLDTDTKKLKKYKKIKVNDNNGENNESISDEYLEIIEDYLNPPFDEKDFDDVKEKDKRTFCKYFLEKFINNQIFINTFYINESLRPRELKILVLSLTIELYFIVNAFFYTEDYLSDRYHSNEKESFFSFIPNRINEFIYVSCVNGIIAYLINYMFENEEILKSIFQKDKKHKKEKLDSFMKEIKRKFIALIIISIIISIFSFLYLSSFNVVYPYIRIEWIKSSIFILILMQIINFLFALLETCFRFLSIKYDSIRLFRISELLD